MASLAAKASTLDATPDRSTPMCTQCRKVRSLAKKTLGSIFWMLVAALVSAEYPMHVEVGHMEHSQSSPSSSSVSYAPWFATP
jgi:hypothetical protein